MNTSYNLNIRSVAAISFVAMLVMFSAVMLPHLAFAQDDGDYGGADLSDDGGGYYSGDTGCCGDSDYGGADIAPDTEDYGGADLSSDDYGGADLSNDDYGGADLEYDSATPEYSYTDYGTDEYGTDTYGSASYGYSTPISAPFSSGYGSYGYSTPIIASSIPSAPIIQNLPPSYNQPSQPNVTNNTCVNYSCNTVTTVSNSGNTTISNSGNTVTTVVPVAAAPVTYPAQYTFQNVSCTITASQNSVQAGQYTYLTWQSYGATSATLTNYGNVAPNGSLSIQPYGAINYVLTVYGYNGQTSTCNVYVNVGSSYPSVTLSQIPYTGFDLGTFGDAMYFALLAAFALAAGYLLVYYRGGMGAFALAMTPSRKTPVSTVKVEKKVAPALSFAKASEDKPVKASNIGSLPAFSNVRPTSDSMVIASKDGAPRIVINRG